MTLRPYQQNAIDQIYDYLRNHDGNLVAQLPTGSGKSHIIAGLCESSLKAWPETRILMLTHQRELISQNSEKMRAHWANAPMGIWSAGLRRKELDAITFAGIQSIRGKADLIGHIDLVLIDECHLVSHKEEGSYRTLLAELKEINPHMRVVGLSATPWRLGWGVITGTGLFDDLIEPVTIPELQAQGYLANLKSKRTKEQLSTDGVHKRGGEYIEKELQAAVDTEDHNEHVVDEIIAWGAREDRRWWLIFCTGIDHAEHIRDRLRERGVTAETVTGKTPLAERDRILEEYRAGHIRAITNVGVMTTGMDIPSIDLIAFLRPTMSPSLYAQMAGRGLRLKDHTDYCRVLDFAGLVAMHGPITEIIPPRKKGEGEGIAPAKLCPNCDEMLHTSVMVCPECGHEFPPMEREALALRDDDIMGIDKTKRLEVTSWNWDIQTSRKTEKEMIVVTYYGAMNEQPIREYLCIWHEGYAGRKGNRMMAIIAAEAGLPRERWADSVPGFLLQANARPAPSAVIYVMEGRYPRVVEREWLREEEEVPF